MFQKIAGIFLLFVVLTSLLISPLNFGIVEASLPSSETNGSILYVKPNGSGNCSSWSLACGLQTAIYQAGPGDQIWVAAGTYKPSIPTNREATFQLESGVNWYGGFPTNGGNWEARDWQSYPTILSGDIGISGEISDNSYHVVTSNEVDETTVLDGFFIEKGNANGSADNGNGGGMFNYYSQLNMRNLLFRENVATGAGGGGLYNYFSGPNMTDIFFVSNYSNGDGAGIHNYNSNPNMTGLSFYYNYAQNGSGGGLFNGEYSSPTLIDVDFIQNSANFSGGGMSNHWYCSPTLLSVRFINNYANQEGGGLANGYSSNPELDNVIFSENSARIEGGGLYNYYYSSPKLTNVRFENNSAGKRGGE